MFRSDEVVESGPAKVIAETHHPKWPICITVGNKWTDLFLTVDEAKQLVLDLVDAIRTHEDET